MGGCHLTAWVERAQPPIHSGIWGTEQTGQEGFQMVAQGVGGAVEVAQVLGRIQASLLQG